jgi:hypothetical protein
MLFNEVNSVNGVTIDSGSGTQPAGDLSYIGDFGDSFPTQTFPYSYKSVSDLAGFHIVVTAQCASSGATPIVSISITPPAFWDPGDDRLNRDPGQPAALYCRNGGDVQVWRVDPVTSIGKLSFTATKLEIANVKNSKPAHNTLIKASADGAFKLYYLPASDELSFIATYPSSGKPYYFVFKGCS